MTTPFAAIEARANQAIIKHMANVVATVDGVSVPAIFTNAYDTASVGANGIASTQPMLTLPTTDAPASPIGKPVVINATSYTIAAHQPDGTGLSHLLLEHAA